VKEGEFPYAPENLNILVRLARPFPKVVPSSLLWSEEDLVSLDTKPISIVFLPVAYFMSQCGAPDKSTLSLAEER
jgi:hypothetical protein